MASRSALTRATAVARWLAMGYRAHAAVRNPVGRWWWSLAQDHAGWWYLVNLPESLSDAELLDYDPTVFDPGIWTPEPYQQLMAHERVVDLMTSVIQRPRNTTIAGQWERRCVNAYLDSVGVDERSAIEKELRAAAPEGWRTLQEVRVYEENLAVPGRQAEAVELLKATMRRLWPTTMTSGRLTQFGRRHADEVFMVLPYASWADEAEAALKRVAADPETSTGDSLRALVMTRPFSLDLLV